MQNKNLLISIICHFIIESKKSGEIGSPDNDPLLEDADVDYIDEINSMKKLERVELIDRLENKLESVNSTLFNYLRVSTIVICKDEWTPQNEILTPTMKIKRGNVDKMYMSKYDEWHHSNDKVIWE